MASSYALPQPPLPHNHGHSHSHSHSHSPPSFGHSRSTRSLQAYPQGQRTDPGHGHSHSHDHDHDHDHSDHEVQAQVRQNMSQYRANSIVPLQRRENRPSPLRQNTEELPSPQKKDTIDALKTPSYDAPTGTVLHDHGHGGDGHHHHHHHAQGPSYSTFTALLLPYTSKWPLIHAIMTEKDSRRIFYFMGYDLDQTHVLLRWC